MIHARTETTHSLMVSMDARQTSEIGFDSLLRHFFKNSNKHLALPGHPGGVTIWHAHATSIPQWLNGAKNGGYYLMVVSSHNGHFIKVNNQGVKTWGGQTVDGENNHESKFSCNRQT